MSKVGSSSSLRVVVLGPRVAVSGRWWVVCTGGAHAVVFSPLSLRCTAVFLLSTVELFFNYGTQSVGVAYTLLRSIVL